MTTDRDGGPALCMFMRPGQSTAACGATLGKESTWTPVPANVRCAKCLKAMSDAMHERDWLKSQSARVDLEMAGFLSVELSRLHGVHPEDILKVIQKARAQAKEGGE